MLSHHHVVEGVSLAHFGELPEGFVTPTVEAFRDGSAMEYGWEVAGLEVSGRPVDHMPKSRKVTTFGEVDVEGNQVWKLEYYGSDSMKWGTYDDRRTIGDKKSLVEAFSYDEPMFVQHTQWGGCFGRTAFNTYIPYVSLALLPVKTELIQRYSNGYTFMAPLDIPVERFEEAVPNANSPKWRRFKGYILKQADYEPIDIGMYKC